MRTLKSFAVMALVAAAAEVAMNPVVAASLPSDEMAWESVPDQTLSQLRGGVDIPHNNLVAYFAIQRVIEVDGAVVARMQIVISNLDSGTAPTISISGATGDLVRIMDALPVSAPTLPAGTDSGAAAVTTKTAGTASASAPATAAVASAAIPATPVAVASPDVSGNISKSNTQSGSMAQFGSALASATSAATGATGATSGGTSTPGSTSAPLAANAAPTLAANAAPTSGPTVAAASAGSTPISQIGPVSPAPVVVVSNLPNAAAITAAVQNDVRAATIQIQTTITATLNSLSPNNALSLADAIRAQVTAATH